MDRQLEDKILRIVRDCVCGRGLDTRYLRAELRKLSAPPQEDPRQVTIDDHLLKKDPTNAAA